MPRTMPSHQSLTATRIGVIYSPPTFLVEYQTNGGTHHRKIRINNLSSDADANQVCTSLITQFPEYLDSVPSEQVSRMVGKIIGNLDSQRNHQPITTKEIPENEEEFSRAVEADSSSGGTEAINDGRETGASLPAPSNPRLSDKERKKLESFGDLNRVDPAELHKAKAEMDVAFNAARLKPGDKDYVFDKREDFDGADLDSSWD